MEKLDYETILEILDYWFEEWPKNYNKLPPGLKDKFDEKEVLNLALA